jgi:hypothetical protein
LQRPKHVLFSRLPASRLSDLFCAQGGSHWQFRSCSDTPKARSNGRLDPSWLVPATASLDVQETKEEIGIDCEITGLVGIYSDPKHVILYSSNGEVRQEFSIVLTARATGGVLTRSDESSDAQIIHSDDPRPTFAGAKLTGVIWPREMPPPEGGN